MAEAWPLVGRDTTLRTARDLLERPDPRAVALVGEPGVGKTRLAAELAEAGAPAVWTRGTEAAAAIPLGALTHLLPATPGRALHEVIAAGARAVAELGDGAVLVFDDAHLLDDASLSMVRTVVEESAARTVLTVTRGRPFPPTLVGLWQDGLVERIEVAPLRRADVAVLVRRVMGRESDRELLDRVWSLTRGNALFLAELLLALRRGADLTSMPTRLRELVGSRLAALDDPTRQALELVAIGEPVPLAVIDPLAPGEDLERLEVLGLVAVDEDRRVRTAHPMYGEVVREELGPIRRRNLLRALVVALEETGSDLDPPRTAVWRLEAGALPRPGRLTEAAWTAFHRFDNPLAEQLARPAFEAGESEAAFVLAEALLAQDREEEAESVLAAIVATEPAHLARVAIARATIDQLRGDLDAAGRRLAAAETRLADDEAARHDCQAHLAVLAMAAGRLGEAAERAEAVVTAPDASESAVVRASMAVAHLWVGRGRSELVAERVAGWIDAAGRHPEIVLADPVLRLAWFRSLLGVGRIDDAVALAERDLGMDLGDVPTGLAAVLLGLAGRAHYAAGRVRTALSLYRQAVELGRDDEWFSLLPLGHADLARVAALCGELDLAERAIADALARSESGSFADALATAEIGLCEAWVRASRGDDTTAVALAMTAAEGGEELLAGRLDAYHDAARLGGLVAARSLRHEVDEIAARIEGPWAAAVAAHVGAIATDDPVGLTAVADRMERLGARLVAYEANARAEARLRRSRRLGEADAVAVDVARLHALCERALLPTVRPDAGDDPLTDREREIAALAAGGASSKGIAVHLDISVRTVDTHLGRIYRKLGVEGRIGLVDLYRGGG